MWVSRQGGLARSRQTEEQGDISVATFIRGRMQGKNVVFDRHEIEHDCENAFLHLTGVLSTKDDHLLCFEVDGHTGT